MKHSLPLLLSLLLYTFTILPAVAQEQDDNTFAQPTQEFPFSQPVYLQEEHEVQGTLGYEHDNMATQKNNAFSYEMEYGITNWLQVSGEFGYTRQRIRDMHVKSYGLTAGAMVSLLNTASQAISLQLEAEFPVKKPAPAYEEAEGRLITFTPMLLYARQLGNLQLHLNGGSELQAHEHAWFYNAVAVYGSGRWHPLLELNGTYEEEASWYLAPGLVLNYESGWEIIAGVRRNLREADWGLSVKLVYELKAEK